jgi:hypothetical protein
LASGVFGSRTTRSASSPVAPLPTGT